MKRRRVLVLAVLVGACSVFDMGPENAAATEKCKSSGKNDCAKCCADASPNYSGNTWTNMPGSKRFCTCFDKKPK
jgi:uncharacterized membrane protein